MTRLLKLVLAACLLHTVCASADELDQLPMNGIAAFEQLRLEYYIGALLTPSPSSNPENLQAQPGPLRMSLRITAEKWPAMRFAQQWNQLILINNDSKVLNQNLMDVLGFTSFLKEDLVAGDQLTIDLTEADTTLVSLNGAPMFASASPALFQMLLRTWIGPRAPSSEFKRDMLIMPTEASGSGLIARFEATRPDDARIALTKGWAMDPATDLAAATGIDNIETTPAVASASPAARAASTPSESAAAADQAPPTDDAVAARAPAAAPVIAAPEVAAPKVAAPAVARPELKEAVAVTSPAVDPAPVSQPAAPAAVPVAATTLREITPETRPLDPALQLKVALNNYNNRLRALVYREVSYPRRAVSRNLEGLVVVRAQVAQDGNLLSAEVAQSADSLLDRAALEAVQQAAPFPTIEELPPGGSHTFIVPMIFKLD